MATSNSKPTQLLLVTFLTFFLLLLSKVKSLDDLSFTFKKFNPNQMDLIIQRDASILSNGVLRVIPAEKGRAGAALYNVPVHIWDSTTGRVASFTTSFSFVVNGRDPGDGLTFFLAPPDFQVRGISGQLAIFKNGDVDPIKSYQTVAVEFDTFHNAWDPQGRHIGIDVNGIKSIATAPWEWRNGEVASVLITYEASLKRLTASLTYPSNKAIYIVAAIVDLKEIFPEWVRVGFSASSGDYVQESNVLDWKFSSTFKANNCVAVENNVIVA